jgi:hypothetical protein
VIGRPPTWGTSFPGEMLPTVTREIESLRTELAVHDGDTSPVVGTFRRCLDLLERDGLMLVDRDRFEIRSLLQRAQGRVTSTAVFLTGVATTILGVGGACILMDYTAAALGPASFSSGPWWEP